MAERLNKRHSESCKERIRTSQLISRLQNHALGTLTDKDGQSISMTPEQVRAACFLIERKLARAEAPRKMEVTGTLTLEQLLTQSFKPAEDKKSETVQ